MLVIFTHTGSTCLWVELHRQCGTRESRGNVFPFVSVTAFFFTRITVHFVFTSEEKTKCSIFWWSWVHVDWSIEQRWNTAKMHIKNLFSVYANRLHEMRRQQVATCVLTWCICTRESPVEVTAGLAFTWQSPWFTEILSTHRQSHASRWSHHTRERVVSWSSHSCLSQCIKLSKFRFHLKALFCILPQK